MFQWKADAIDKRGDTTIEDDNEVQRAALVMVPKDNDFDPQFPAAHYRMGRYVTISQAKKQQYLEYMSKSIYDLCVKQKSSDLVQCYKQKCGVMRTILEVIKRS